MTNPLAGEPRPLPQTTVRAGQVVVSDGSLQVNVGGVVLPARWADPLVVKEGDPVLVALTSGATGQSEAVVMCRTSARPRAAQGTVASAPPGSTTITVDTVEGVVTAPFLAPYTPAIGDLVVLAWGAGEAVVMGKVGAVPAPPVVTPPPAPPAAPPPPSASGTLEVPSTDSATFNVGAGRWLRPDEQNGSSVVQGSYNSPTFTGSWFYGWSASQLDGAAITAVRIWVGPRRRIGDYNSALPLHVHLHTSPGRPGGDVARVAGPIDLLIPPNFPGGWFGLDAGWGPILVAGGGISITGSPYLAIAGRGDSPQSGLLSIDWSR